MDFLTANDRPGEHAPSFYAASAGPIREHPRLTGIQRADVCIVGGGYSGLSAALHLARRGYDVALLEAQRVGWGASGRNGGQVGSGLQQDQAALEASMGEADARRLWLLTEEAKALVRKLIAEHEIDCHPVPGLLYPDHKLRYTASTRRRVEHLQARYDYTEASFVDRDELRAMLASPRYHAAMLDKGGFHIDPLALALGMARAAETAGARLHELSRVLRIEGDGPVQLRTTEGSLKADHLILACNGYLCGLEPRVGRKVMPINNFIVATEPLGEERARALIRDNVGVADSKFVINYFRLSRDWRLLFGGTESYSFRFPADIARAVRRPLAQVFPQLADIRIDHAWGGTLGITVSRLPHFAQLGPAAFSISGYSGHGVGFATLAGRLAAEAVAGQAERFDLVSRLPTPDFPGGVRLRNPLLKLAMTWYALRDRL